MQVFDWKDLLVLLSPTRPQHLQQLTQLANQALTQAMAPTRERHAPSLRDKPGTKILREDTRDSLEKFLHFGVVGVRLCKRTRVFYLTPKGVWARESVLRSETSLGITESAPQTTPIHKEKE